MERLIILGASALQVPLIKQASKMGYYTTVFDFNPEAVGIQYANDYYQISTIDETQVFNKAKELKPKAILTAATDMPMRAVAYASEKLGLPSVSYETAVICTDKALMAEKLALENVRSPRFIKIDNDNSDNLNELVAKLTFPVIVKPVDSSGSRGVIKVTDKSNLEQAVIYARRYSKVGNIIIEEYIEGDEVSVEVLINDGNIFVIAITDKVTTNSPHFIEVGHYQPTHFSNKIQEKIKDTTIDAIKALKINSGAAHAELRIKDGKPYIIEVGARLGGDYITSHLTPLNTGFNMIEGLINIATGNILNINIAPNNSSYAIRFIPLERTGIFKGISNLNIVTEHFEENIVETVIYPELNSQVEHSNSSNSRLGHFILVAKNRDELEEIFANIIAEIAIEIQ